MADANDGAAELERLAAAKKAWRATQAEREAKSRRRSDAQAAYGIHADRVGPAAAVGDAGKFVEAIAEILKAANQIESIGKINPGDRSSDSYFPRSRIERIAHEWINGSAVQRAVGSIFLTAIKGDQSTLRQESEQLLAHTELRDDVANLVGSFVAYSRSGPSQLNREASIRHAGEVAAFLRSYGYGQMVAKEISTILNHEPGETSALVAAANDKTLDAPYRQAIHALAAELGQLYRRCLESKLRSDAEPAAAAAALEVRVARVLEAGRNATPRPALAGGPSQPKAPAKTNATTDQKAHTKAHTRENFEYPTGVRVALCTFAKTAFDRKRPARGQITDICRAFIDKRPDCGLTMRAATVALSRYSHIWR